MQLFVHENSTVIQQLFASSEAVSAYLRSLEGGERNIDATSSFNLFAEPRELWTALATPFVQTVLGYVTMGYHFSVFLKNHSYYRLLHVILPPFHYLAFFASPHTTRHTQHDTRLQENLRLSGKTSGVAQYLLGLSHLDLAQFDKATECFLHALTTLSSDGPYHPLSSLLFFRSPTHSHDTHRTRTTAHDTRDTHNRGVPVLQGHAAGDDAPGARGHGDGHARGDPRAEPRRALPHARHRAL
jgi:hypothetical protein